MFYSYVELSIKLNTKLKISVRTVVICSTPKIIVVFSEEWKCLFSNLNIPLLLEYLKSGQWRFKVCRILSVQKSFCHKLWFRNFYIFATHRSLIFQTYHKLSIILWEHLYLRTGIHLRCNTLLLEIWNWNISILQLPNCVLNTKL